MQIRITPVVKVLLISNFVIFLFQQTADRFFDGNFLFHFALVPHSFLFDFKIWQIVTYAFLHAEVMHLFFNLLMLVFLAGELESIWGAKKFIRFYVFCAVVAGFCYLLMSPFLAGGGSPMVGASGAIYGILMAYGILFAERTLLFMLIFPMKAKHFVWILAAIEFMTTVFSPSGGPSSVAHLGGMGAGFLYLYGAAFFRIRQRQKSADTEAADRKARVERARASGHLKLVGGNKDSDEPEDRGPTWH